MADYTVQPSKLKQEVDTLSSFVKASERNANDADSVRQALQSQGGGLFTVSTNLAETIEKIHEASAALQKTASALESISNVYQETETKVCGRYITGTAGNKENAKNKGKEKGSASEKERETSLYGAVKKTFNKVKSWYQKNEDTLKAYGKSAYRITKGVIKVVGAVGAITTGVGVPLGILELISGANDIGNGVADLIYSAYGEYDKVGTTDVLKTYMEQGYGALGELCGNREAGEMLGRVLYTGIDIVSFLDGTDKMLKAFGKLNIDMNNVVQTNSFIFGEMSWEDVFDNEIKATNISGIVRKIAGVNPDSTANIIYEAVEGTVKTFKDGVETAEKVVDAILGA